MEFALEAKCCNPGVGGLRLNTVGVKETSRLISRLRHRRFGILVTTAVVARQAYEEIRQDRHPVVILCGSELARILINKGLNSGERVRETARLISRLRHREFGILVTTLVVAQQAYAEIQQD